MGLLRVLLSIAVLVSHSENLLFLRMPAGSMAVEAFFIISGFYMSLIITDKYSLLKNSYWLFISNRFLRLFPAYWVIALFTIVVSIIVGAYSNDHLILEPYFEQVHSLNIFSILFLFLTNTIIFFQDVVMYLGLNASGALQFVKNFNETDPKLWNFLIVPQAWSIGIELVFYLLAPFFFKLKNYQLAICFFLSVAIKLSILNSSLNFDPWNHRFMPAEVCYFIAGIFMHRYYQFIKRYDINKKLLFIPFGVMIMVTAFFQYIPSPTNDIRFNFYLTLLIICMPFIFLLTRKSKLDQWLGEFTYPLYLIHFFVIEFITKIFIAYNFNNSFLSETSLLISLLLSYIIFTYVSKPIEKIRQARIN